MLLKADPKGIYLRSAFKEHLYFQIQSVQQTLYQLSQKAYQDVIKNFSILAETESMIPSYWKELTTRLW